SMFGTPKDPVSSNTYQPSACCQTGKYELNLPIGKNRRAGGVFFVSAATHAAGACEYEAILTHGGQRPTVPPIFFRPLETRHHEFACFGPYVAAAGRCVSLRPADRRA